MHSKNTGLFQQQLKRRLKLALGFGKTLLFQNRMSQQRRRSDFEFLRSDWLPTAKMVFYMTV